LIEVDAKKLYRWDMRVGLLKPFIVSSMVGMKTTITFSCLTIFWTYWTTILCTWLYE